jgi:hypothetical protein
VQTQPSTSSEPPSRPDAAARALRTERRWTPTIAVVVVIAVVLLGGYVTADALSASTAPPRTIGGVVTIDPAGGWRFAEDVGEPSGARITRGSGTLDVLTGPAVGDAAATARAYVLGSLEPSSNPLTVSPGLDAVTVGGTLPAVRLSYTGVFDQSGVPIEGEVTVAVTPGGSGVVFDAWAPQGQLRFVLDDAHAMEAGAVFSR